MNARLRSLIISNSFFILGGSLLVPVYALFTESIGAGIQLTGILFAAKFAANAFADLVILTLRDRLSLTVSFYRFSMLIRGVCWIYLGMFPTIPNLLIVQIITGLAEGFGTPAFSALLADNLDKGKHMKEWAVWDLIKNPLIAVGGVVSGYIVSQYSFMAMFMIMGILAISASCIPIAARSRFRKKKT